MPPIKAFILAGQSNMVGMGAVKHLKQLIDDPNAPNEFRETLWDPSKLMFGWTMADAMEETDTVLLIKTAWGGKSLMVDFRPPSSGMPPDGKNSPDPKNVGLFYRKMIQDIKETLSQLAKTVPGYTDEIGYKLQGFVWFQGWNDMLNWPSVKEYGENLSNLIRDVRRDLDAPSLPFVIGELGQHGPLELIDQKKRWASRVIAFRNHQREVTLQEEFLDNTILVETGEFMVFGKETFNGAYHYNGRADTFFNIGQALGYGMLELIKDR